jgi:DNA-binding SARP family transcriptional activator
MQHVRFSLLGRCEIATRHFPLITFPKSCEGLVAMLAMSKGKGVDRFRAAQLLWPDYGEQRARQNLSTALWRLKSAHRSLESLFAQDCSSRIHFAPDVRFSSDVQRFELLASGILAGQAKRPRAIQVLRERRAEALYNGQAFLGIDAEWADVERERLHTLFLDLLHHMALGRFEHGEIADCIRIGQQLITLDPYREDVHRLLMRAHMKAGNRAKAILQYRMCEGEISQALGTAPMPETVELYESFIARSDRIRPPSSQVRRNQYIEQASSGIDQLLRGNARNADLLHSVKSLISKAGSL